MTDYLTEKTTYYKISSLINNNYELFENLTDSLVFDVSSQSDEINYYLNENEAVTLSLIASRIVRNFFLKYKSSRFLLLVPFTFLFTKSVCSDKVYLKEPDGKGND